MGLEEGNCGGVETVRLRSGSTTDYCEHSTVSTEIWSVQPSTGMAHLCVQPRGTSIYTGDSPLLLSCSQNSEITQKFIHSRPDNKIGGDAFNSMAFPSGGVVKNSPACAGDGRDVDLISGLGRSPGGGNGNPLQYSCLGNPMDRAAWGYSLWGHKEPDTSEPLATHTHTHTHTHSRAHSRVAE